MTYLIQGNHDSVKTEDHHTESVIIGFWRMGAPLEEIASLVEWPQSLVERVIESYKIEHKIKRDK